jgi:dipeptidyl aminopeptidase/acylaminoacyl peptidase
MIVLQGTDDQVVPQNQAEMMVRALQANGVPHAYLLFAGEGHGFRRSENIIRALEAELSFYAQLFGFTPADPIDPVPIRRPS